MKKSLSALKRLVLSPSSSQSPDRPGGLGVLKKPVRIALYGVGTVLLLGALAWALLPVWMERRLPVLIGEALGRPVQLQAVRVQPWRLGVELEGLRIGGPEAGAVPLLELRRISAAASLRSLWHGAPVLAELVLDEPVLRLARVGEGRLDIDDLIRRFSQPSDSKSSGGTRLAIYNIELHNGQVLFDDQPKKARHRLSGLELALPFVSTLDTDVEVKVHPRLEGRLNDAAFASEVSTQPFAKTRTASLSVQLQPLDLAPYRPYLPADLPLTLRQGLLDGRLQLDFSQPAGQAPQLRLSGELGLQQLRLGLPGLEPDWLALDSLKLGLKDVQPLLRRVHLEALELRAPRLLLTRDKNGALSLPGAKPVVAPVVVGGRGAQPADAGKPWQLLLDRLQLEQGQLRWQDRMADAALRVDELQLKAQRLQWPAQWPAARDTGLSLDAVLTQDAEPASAPAQVKKAAAARAAKPAAPAAPVLAKLSVKGRWIEAGPQLEAQLDALPLGWLQGYLRPFWPARVDGSLSVQGQLQLDPQFAPRRLSEGRLQLNGLQARTDDKTPDLAWTSLTLEQLSADLEQHSLSLGKLALDGPSLRLRRNAQGLWNLPGPASAPAGAVPVVPAAASASSPTQAETRAAPRWRLAVEQLLLDKGRAVLDDQQVQARVLRDGQRVLPAADNIRLSLSRLAWPASGSVPLQLSLEPRAEVSGALRERQRGTPARLQWQGNLALEPLALNGSLRAERLPLHWLDPYLDPQLGLHLRRAEAGFKGQVQLTQSANAAWQARVGGDLLVADLRLLQSRWVDGQREAGDELLTWQALNLNGAQLAWNQGQAPQLKLAEVALQDFYARLIVNEQGQLNLQQVGAGAPPAASAPASSAAPAAAAAPAPAASAPALQLSVAQTRVQGGRIDFSDRFIKPNYSAHLTELGGSLGAFAYGSSEMATLSLRGKVEGTGLLDIGGQLNPSGRPPALDITASASDIELAPLSPYAGKYAGYEIERGKLSTRVHYRVAPDGLLQAENQVVLNQLEFGERIDSPDATKLPVLLAVALLKDRHGVIDVNLPISGSINDPEFSIGGLVFRLIVNLLGKALTAPFSLLSGGGGSESSELAFVPGSVELAEPQRLEALAKSLQDRPSLQLNITGWADPKGEADAVRALKLEQALLAERRRELQRQQTARSREQAESSELQLDAAQRSRLLKQLYANSDLKGRPRNLIGLLKDVPEEQMRRMLMDSYALSSEAMRELALARAVAVRDGLLARGVANARLFMAAPKLHEAEEGAEGVEAAPGKAWQPHVTLGLSLR